MANQSEDLRETQGSAVTEMNMNDAISAACQVIDREERSWFET